MEIKTLSELDVAMKRVFVRADLNTPLTVLDGKVSIKDPFRIHALLPTLKNLIDRKAKIILASHLGRPKGFDPMLSLTPVGEILASLLPSMEIIVADNSIGSGIRSQSNYLKPHQILLLENLRFHQEEEDNSPEFAGFLRQLADVYLSDAFGALHRAHASVSALPLLFEKDKGMGLLVEKELSYLTPLRDNPKKPLALILGGSKVASKLPILEKMLPHASYLFIGGAMSYSFLKAQGIPIGKSFTDEKDQKIAKDILAQALRLEKKIIYLPIDHRVLCPDGSTQITEGVSINPDDKGMDIGPKTSASWLSLLSSAQTIFWNGPLGKYEDERFSQGTKEIAMGLGSLPAKKIVGGGDVAAAIHDNKLHHNFDFISTGGGATLEYLEGKPLPGLLSLLTSS